MRTFSRTVLFITAAISVFAFAASAHAQNIFTDNFTLPNGSTDPNWTIANGTWSVNNGRYASGTHSALTPITTSFANTAALTNFNVDVDIKGSQDGGFLLRAQNANNAIALIVRPNFNDVYWHVRQGGNWGAALNSTALGFGSQPDLHVSVSVIGNQYNATITNGLSSRSLAFNSSAFASGQVALYNFGDSESFDNFVISAVNTPEPGSVALMTAAMLSIGCLCVRRRFSRSFCKRIE